MTSRFGSKQARSKRKWLSQLAGAALLVLPTSSFAQSDNGDPLEPINRFVFGFNQIVDGLILDPAQQIYGYVMPEPAKIGLRNFLDNLASPVILINDVLQGERERAGTTLSRFMVNSSLGVGGIFDVATAFGLPERHSEDFGQTLGSYGLGGGPYIVLPLLGPSNLRDVAGRGVDMFVFSPWGFVVDDDALAVRTALDAVDTRYRFDAVLDDLEANSLDEYSALRSVYRQRRAVEILNGAAPPVDDSYEDIFDEDPS